MKEFYAFDITIRPEDSPKLSSALKEHYPDDSQKPPIFTDQTIFIQRQGQIKALIDTANHVQQAKILGSNPTISTVKQNEHIDSIYGKAAKIISDRDAVAKAYERMSNEDAHRTETLRLNINGIVTTIKNFSQQVVKHHEIEETKNITMDHIVNYLQNKYKVKISEAQKNFLRTQWNQGSIQGAGGACLMNSFPHGTVAFNSNPSNPHYHVFSFDESMELTSTQYVMNIHTNENHQNPEAKGTITTTADLKEISLSTDGYPWIPSSSANSVTISYSSTNLPCSLDFSICKAVQQHAQMNDKKLVNAYYKTKASVSNTINSIGQVIYNISNSIRNTINNTADWISEKYNSFKSPNNNENSRDSDSSTAIFYSTRERSTSRDSIDSFHTARDTYTSRDSIDVSQETLPTMIVDSKAVKTMPPDYTPPPSSNVSLASKGTRSGRLNSSD